MKNLVVELAKSKRELITKTAEENKKLVAKSNNRIKNQQLKMAKQVPIEVAPETQTIMLGVK